jgi:hypothetical protein
MGVMGLEDAFEKLRALRADVPSEDVLPIIEAELRSGRGIVTCPNPAPGVALDHDRPISYQQDEQFYSELKRAMTAAFTNVGDDAAALEACFVESRQSRDADSQLARIENELQETVADAAKYPPFAEQQIKDQPGRDDAALPDADALRGKGCIARILGARSAGKTWFLRRFYETQLPRPLRKKAAVVWIDAEAFEPFDPDRVSLHALEQLRDQLFGAGGPEWTQLISIYASEWRAWLRPQGVAPNEAPQELRREFARTIDANEKRDPSRALYKHADFAVRNRGQLPCFVVDNADGLDHARRAADWVVATHKNSFALTTLAVDDDTLWRLRSRGEEDYVSRQSPEQFWLPRPKVKEVIENRCRYLSTSLRQAAPDGATLSTRVGFHRQYTWTVDVEKLAAVVSAVLLEDQEISRWIGEICNYDIRQVLDLCKEIVLSPRVKATELLKGQTTGKFDRRRVMKAIISPKNEQYQNRSEDRVTNIFGFWLGDDWAPLLPFRALAYLSHLQDGDKARGEPFPGFAPVSDLLTWFTRDLGTPRKLVVAMLDRLRSQELIELDNPSRAAIDGTNVRAQITSRGRLHLEWARDITYARMMAEVDPISEPGVEQQMRKQWQSFLDASTRADSRRNMHSAELGLIRFYVDHVVRTAERVSPLRGRLEVVGPLEDALIKHWLEEVPARPAKTRT